MIANLSALDSLQSNHGHSTPVTAPLSVFNALTPEVTDIVRTYLDGSQKRNNVYPVEVLHGIGKLKQIAATQSDEDKATTMEAIARMRKVVDLLQEISNWVGKQ